MSTRVVNRRREREEAYIGRGSMFGNPFVIGRDGSREDVIVKYIRWFEQRLSDPGFEQAVERLRGRVLGCYCRPLACHGQVIVGYLDDPIAFRSEHSDHELRLWVREFSSPTWPD